jgi:hypothetical protein
VSLSIINSGTTYIISRNATLNLSAADSYGVVAYYASENSTPPSATSEGWVSIAPSQIFNQNVSVSLSSGDGPKTVYVWFKDGADNISSAVSD